MEKHKNAIRLGLIWAGISVATTLLLYLLGIMENPYAGALLFIFGIYMMYQSGKEKRIELGGYINWKQALTPIWLTSVISGFISTLFSWVLFRFIDPDLQAKQKEKAIEMTEKLRSLIGDEATEKELEKLENFDFTSLGNYLNIFLWTLLLYFIIAAILALILRKKDPQEIFDKY